MKALGPLRAVEFDCQGCEGSATLNDEGCRVCIFDKISSEGKVDWTFIGREVTRAYTSRDLSKLAERISTAKRLVVDAILREVAGAKRETMSETENMAIEELFKHVTRNPHQICGNEMNKVRCLFGKVFGKRGDNLFKKCVESVENTLGELKFLKRLESNTYDKFFGCRAKPFFVDGVWHGPPEKAKLIDSYALSGGRGKVAIYERENSPMPFYHLQLPEFDLPSYKLSILYRAFRVEIEEAPGHARFARSATMRDFAEEWYAALMYMVKEGTERLTSSEIMELARTMANWLAYRGLEALSHDDKITDLYIHAPPELQPILLEHERWGKVETGIRLTTPSLLGLGETLASRLGTAFDEVHPQLDAEIPELGIRLFLSRYPAIWPRSVEIAVRRRRSKPWTQPLFLERGTLTPLASSVLGNLLRLGSSAFVIGEMGTAKTSQVETYVPEIGPDNRIIAFQDTEELHVEDFVKAGYKLSNVRIADPEHLEHQINAFLRGGASYWLITEVRAAGAVRAALGAAARQGSQPVVASFHARSKREMYDLIVHIMGLHPAAFRYVDLIVSTARFTTKWGTMRRIVEVSEVLKEWKDEPEYVELFEDDRKRDLLCPKNIFKGNRSLIEKVNSYDLSKIHPGKLARSLEFLSPDKGGSHLIPLLCKKLAVNEEEFIQRILVEARMKSDLLMLSKKTGNTEFLELPFISRAYGAFFSSIKRNAPDYGRVMEEWRAWLKQA